MKNKSLSILKQVKLFALLMMLSACADNFKFTSSVFRSEGFVQLSSTEQYDFLWVLDNSVSMQDKRDYVRDNLTTFLNTLNSRKAIDYRMAMVTTDYFSHVGNLVKSASNLEVVSSQSADPIADFSSIINNVQNSITSFWEQGLESAYVALANHGNRFLRTGVPLIVIFLTDEDDFSCANNCVGVEPENNPNWIAHPVDRYVTNFTSIKSNEGVDVMMFPIVGTGSSACAVASQGTRYMQVQAGMGTGAVGSICLADLPTTYANIARFIADRGVRFPLAAQASGTGITVYVNGAEVPYSLVDGYYYDSPTNSIIFTGNAIPHNGDSIEVRYSQQAGA